MNPLLFPNKHRLVSGNAVASQRARHGIPKLSDILVRVVENGALTSELSERRVYELVLGIGAPRHAKKDIGIHQARGNRHLIVSLVNPLARNSLRQWRNLVGELGQRVEPGADFFWRSGLPSFRWTRR